MDACPLSPRQREVVATTLQGLTYQQTARELGVAPSTVRSHLHNAYATLGVSSSYQAGAVMLREGWLEPDDLLPDYEGPAYMAPAQQRCRWARDSWLPSPAQRLYLDAFDRLLAQRTDEAAEYVDRCFAVLCGERGVPDRRRNGRSIDSMLLRVGCALITTQARCEAA